MKPVPDIDIQVKAAYVPQDSSPENQRYVFAYTITITNQGEVPAKLLTRYWHISDGNGHVEEVHGAGVVGQQPRLLPGEQFEYTSGAVLATAVGSMEGHYEFITDDKTVFQAPIPGFTLADRRVLH